MNSPEIKPQVEKVPTVEVLRIDDLLAAERVYFYWAEGQPDFTRKVVRDLLLKVLKLRELVERLS